MVTELLQVTVQVRVADFDEGLRFYEHLLNRPPAFRPHEGFAEWELIPGCWLQVALGEPTPGSGPIRLGVVDIQAERRRLVSQLGVEIGEVQTREGVPAAWCTFSDPWGNRLGLFEELPMEQGEA